MVTTARRATLVVLALLMTLALAGTGASTVEAAPERDAVVVSQTQVAERQVDLSVRSKALGGATVNVRLLTPDGWEDRAAGPLAGALSPARLLRGLHELDVGDRRRADPALRDVLVVMPEAGDTGWYSDWWNGGEGGPRPGRPSTCASCAPCWSRITAPANAASWPGCRWADSEPCCMPAGTRGCSVPPRRTREWSNHSPRAASGGAGLHDALRLRTGAALGRPGRAARGVGAARPAPPRQAAAQHPGLPLEWRRHSGSVRCPRLRRRHPRTRLPPPEPRGRGGHRGTWAAT